jgi:hypothetical protein
MSRICILNLIRKDYSLGLKDLDLNLQSFLGLRALVRFIKKRSLDPNVQDCLWVAGAAGAGGEQDRQGRPRDSPLCGRGVRQSSQHVLLAGQYGSVNRHLLVSRESVRLRLLRKYSPVPINDNVKNSNFSLSVFLN